MENLKCKNHWTWVILSIKSRLILCSCLLCESSLLLSLKFKKTPAKLSPFSTQENLLLKDQKNPPGFLSELSSSSQKTSPPPSSSISLCFSIPENIPPGISPFFTLLPASFLYPKYLQRLALQKRSSLQLPLPLNNLQLLQIPPCQVSISDWFSKTLFWFHDSQSGIDTWPPRNAPSGQISCNKFKKKVLPKWGSTNMPLFGRVHECKEYEHWSER